MGPWVLKDNWVSQVSKEKLDCLALRDNRELMVLWGELDSLDNPVPRVTRDKTGTQVNQGQRAPEEKAGCRAIQDRPDFGDQMEPQGQMVSKAPRDKLALREILAHLGP